MGNIIGGLINKMLPELARQGELSAEMMANEKIVQAKQEYEKRRIREKQIRALRNQYRPAAGFLRAEGRGVDVSGATGLPNKLGTP